MVASTTAHSTLSPASSNNDINQVKYLQQQLNLFYLSVNGLVENNTWSVLEDAVLKA